MKRSKFPRAVGGALAYGALVAGAAALVQESRSVVQGAATRAGAKDDTATEPQHRPLRDFSPDDAVLSTYDHLWVEVIDPAKTAAIKRKLAHYGRVVKGYAFRVWGVDVYDDVATEEARATLAKLEGVGETGIHHRGAYDKRIPDLEATLKLGKQAYAIDQAADLDVTFVLTNIHMREPREFRCMRHYPVAGISALRPTVGQI